MNKVEDSDTLTKELTNFLLQAKGEITRLKKQSKQDNDFKNTVTLKFKEIVEENKKLKQKLIEYDNYHRASAIQKKRNARAATKIKEEQESGKKKQEKLQELAILDEIKKFKKLDLESLLGSGSNKRKQKDSESERESDSESEKQKKSKKKKRKTKKSILDLINS